MYKKLCISFSAVVLLFMTVHSAQAGGWAAVTLDEIPESVHAGEAAALNFTVQQHGRTLISLEKAPNLVIQNSVTGEEVVFEARHDNYLLGHYAVEVIFPSDGEWAWRADIAPFPSVELGSIVVEERVATAGGATLTGLYMSLAIVTIGMALAFWRSSRRPTVPETD